LAFFYAKRQIPRNSPSYAGAVIKKPMDHKGIAGSCLARKVFDFRNVALLD